MPKDLNVNLPSTEVPFLAWHSLTSLPSQPLKVRPVILAPVDPIEKKSFETWGKNEMWS